LRSTSRFRFAIRGADDPYVHRKGVLGAHPLEAALLQEAQQLHLHVVGKLGDLVEENRAAVSELEASLFVANGPGKCPPDMAEQLGFDQAFRQGAAVDGNEGGPGPAAFAVDRIGHQLLAGSCFAGEVHREIVDGDITNLFKNTKHFAVLADDVAETAHLAGAQLKAEKIGDVFERGEDAGEPALPILHAVTRISMRRCSPVLVVMLRV
jgi:hypothetical protein